MISSKRIIKLLCNEGRQAVAPTDRLFSSVGDHGAVKVKPTRVVKILVDTRLYDQDSVQARKAKEATTLEQAF